MTPQILPQAQRVETAVDAVRGPDALSIRGAAKAYDVPFSAVHRALKRSSVPLSIWKKRGRSQRLTPDEERIICKAATAFATDGTPLTQEYILALAHLFQNSILSDKERSPLSTTDRPSTGGRDFCSELARSPCASAAIWRPQELMRYRQRR
jgi:helix-turn-helix, Psq domain